MILCGEVGLEQEAEDTAGAVPLGAQRSGGDLT